LLFFILNLVISVILTAVIMVILAKSLTVNWERKNRHPFSYLMPVVLTVVLLYVSLTMTVPRLLDSVAVATKACTVEEVHTEPGTIGSMTIQAGERVLHFNPWQFKFTTGQSFRVTYTPRSRFILEVTEIGQNGTR
jgi:hypothetical protein